MTATGTACGLRCWNCEPARKNDARLLAEPDTHAEYKQVTVLFADGAVDGHRGRGGYDGCARS